MINTSTPACPKCSQDDQVEKVSTIYLQGIGAMKPSVDPQQAPAPAQFTKGQISRLRKLLAPPMSVKRELTRPIHPDLMVLVFTGLLPIFLFGIAGNQRGMLLPVLGVVVLFYVIYILMRKRLIGRFQQQKRHLVEEKSRVEKAVGRWMKAYYCSRDDILFREGASEWVPVEQVEQFMWKESK